jgi:hypothetical protein
LQIGIDDQWRVGLRAVEIHQLDDADVVVRADDGKEHGNQRQPHHIDLDDGLQHRELGIETHGGWHTGHGEHQDQHDQRKPRAALVESLEIIQPVGLIAGAAQQDDHAEAANRHQRIGNGVEHRGGIAGHGTGQDTQQQETHVRNGRVGQHAFQVGLGNGNDITDGQR